MYVQLPLDIESCDQCILQWTYHAGNNWGKCADGTGGDFSGVYNIYSQETWGEYSSIQTYQGRGKVS